MCANRKQRLNKSAKEKQFCFGYQVLHKEWFLSKEKLKYPCSKHFPYLITLEHFGKINTISARGMNFSSLKIIRCMHEPRNLHGRKTRLKNVKTPFFSRYWKFLLCTTHYVTDMRPEPHQFLFWKKISTNMVARGV